MRKALLASTALVALTSVSALAADVTISGSYEMLYKNIDDTGSTTDADDITGESDIDFTFTNTTDSGMTITFSTGTHDGAFDDSKLTIAGTPVGTVAIADRDDSAVAGMDIDVDGYTAEEGRTGTPTYGGGFTDGSGDSISVTLPSMVSGLTLAVAMTDGASDVKSTLYGASFAGAAEGMSYKVAIAANTTDNGTAETDYSHYGLEITAGAITIGGAINSKEVDGDSADYDSSEIGVKYAVNDALTVGAYNRTAETGTATQEFKETAYGATYTIAPGLSASITSTSSDINTTDEDSRLVIGLNASF